MSDAPTTALPLLRATGLGLSFGPHAIFQGVDLDLRPGLTLVRGGDGRGKTSLLRMLAGQQAPSAGRVERSADPVFLADPRSAPAGEAQPLRAWMQALGSGHAGWDPALAADLAQDFGLDEHLDKGLFMLSTGTLRKGLLAAAFASGAAVTLLDTPWAALDARSRGLVSDLLREAASHPRRAFVVADHGLPQDLQDLRLAGLVDLGD